MPSLILVSFDHEEPAQKMIATMQELHQVALLRLTGAALVGIGRDGQIYIEATPSDTVAPAAVAPSTMSQYAAFGIILGSVMNTPRFGFAAAGTIGALFKKYEQDDNAVDQDFRARASRSLRPGRWAVIAYATEVAKEEVRRRLEPFGGDMLSIDFSTADEAELAKEVGIEE